MVVVYLGYRAAFTLNLSTYYSSFASILLLSAEAWGCFLMALYFFQIWHLVEPEPVEAVEGFTVDVLIPTYNEDPDLLRGTIEGAKQMDYPHKTYVLDDGRRPEVAELCRELNVEYIIRDNNLHAKAGNVNNALDRTDGELVIIFDADHIPARNFITRIVGYFQDDRMAFVQTPHAFYNFNSFPANVDFARNHYWEEGQLFYNVIQPGKNYWNAVSFCGSAAMFRRSALEEVGLIATETITEDMHTGMRLHARGWKSLFVNERLVAAQAAPDVTTHVTQRLRWGEGNLSIMAHDNPLTMPGLSIAQRINYFGSQIAWTTGVAKAFIYITPILMLFTGVAPVARLDLTLGLVTLIYLMLTWTAVKVGGNGHGDLWAIEQQGMDNFWTQCRCTWRAIAKQTQGFVVTSKRGKQTRSKGYWQMYLPQILLIVLGSAAIIWATVRFAFGVNRDIVGLIIGSVLILIQIGLAWNYLKKAFAPADLRYSTRHPVNTVRVDMVFHRDGERVVTAAASTDINERGIGLISYQKLKAGQVVEMNLHAGTFHTTVSGTVRYCREMVTGGSARDGKAEGYRVGIEFLDADTESLRTLWDISIQYAVKRQYHKFESPKRSYTHVPVRIGQLKAAPMAKELAEDSVGFELIPASPVRYAVTENIGKDQFTALSEPGLEDGTPVPFQLTTPFGPVSGLGEIAKSEPLVVGTETLTMYTVKMTRFSGSDRLRLQALFAGKRQSALRKVFDYPTSEAPLSVAKPTAVVLIPAIIMVFGLLTVFRITNADRIVLGAIAAGGGYSESDAAWVDELRLQAIEDQSADMEKLYLIRNALLAMEREEDADTLAGLLLKVDPQQVELRLAYANQLAAEGKAAEAEELLEGLLDQSDGDLFLTQAAKQRILLSAARISASMQQADKAAELFEKYFVLEPGDTGARREYAGILLQLGQGDEAISLLNELPQDHDTLHLLAAAYSMQQRFDMAARVYRDMLANNPEDLETLKGLADVNGWMQRYDEAIPLYRRYLSAYPNDMDTRLVLARNLLWAHREAEAIIEFTPMMVGAAEPSDQLWSDFLDAAMFTPRLSGIDWGSLRRLEGQAQNLIETGRVDLLAKLAEVYVKQGYANSATMLLEDCLAKQPGDRELRLRLADLYSGLGQSKLAEKHYERLLEPAENVTVSSPSSAIGPIFQPNLTPRTVSPDSGTDPSRGFERTPNPTRPAMRTAIR
jgi:cellulose synthase/poly-beta-1,6-N-acetylglucosamine synthase-like glycosyltransferase/tetratricopeptide (TPR) repeat protein